MAGINAGFRRGLKAPLDGCGLTVCSAQKADGFGEEIGVTQREDLARPFQP